MRNPILAPLRHRAAAALLLALAAGAALMTHTGTAAAPAAVPPLGHGTVTVDLGHALNTLPP